ncbi:hypothetical protein JCM8202v2_006335 [Rhodotorula sphaerocarpa]
MVPNPLEQLLRTFSHPSPGASSAVSASAGPRSPGPFSPRAEAAGGGDSAALLSLLRGTARAGTVTSPPPPPVKSPLLSPRGGGGNSAKDLLGLLMGSGDRDTGEPKEEEEEEDATPRAGRDKIEAGALAGAETLGLTGMHESVAAPSSLGQGAPSSSATATASEPTSPKSAPAPVFSFVSPFDYLESTRPARKDDAPTVRSPLSAPSPTTQTDNGAAAPPVAPAVPSPSETEVGASSVVKSTGPRATSMPRTYLAANYLPRTPAPAPSWAPLGVRLPRRVSLPYDAPQHLTISTSDPHLEALVPTAPEVTPIALFPVPAGDRESSAGAARRRTAGIWEYGIAYASAGGTGKHRVRVIDRESGAKVLLKGKRDEKDIVDLQVEQVEARPGAKRRIACVGREGRLSMWEVPDRFEDEAEATKQSTRILNIAPNPDAQYAFARFVPDQRTLYAVRSDRVVSAFDLEHPSAKPKEIRLIGGGDIVDVAFSPDAVYAAVLTTESVVTFQLDNSSAQKKTKLEDVLPEGSAHLAEQAAFVSPAPEGMHAITSPEGIPARPLGLAISSAHGTKIHILPVHIQNGRLSLATTATVQIDVAPPRAAEDEPFQYGQVEYHIKTQSLVVSHSLRGSLFTLRLAFVEGPDGEPLIRINHVLEHPTPEPILSFTLDSMTTTAAYSLSGDQQQQQVPEGVRAASKIRYGALAIHPGGVHHIALIAEQPRHYVETAPKHRSHDSDTSSDGEGGPRRMSLEGSIHVSSEVEVTVEEIDVVEVVGAGAEGVKAGENVVQTVLIAASSVDEPEEVEEGAGSGFVTAQGTPRTATSAMPTVTSSPAKAAEPALGDLSRGLTAATTPISELSRPDAFAAPATSVEPTEQDPHVLRRDMAGVPPVAAAEGQKRPAPQDRDVRSELERIERDLPAKVAGIVQRELEGQAARAPSIDTKLHGLEQRLSSAFETAVARQTTAAVQASVAQVLPMALSRQLSHPDLLLTLSESIAGNVAPFLEEALSTQLVSAIAPALEGRLSVAVEGVLDSIRQEMLDVRKEITQEQSGAVSILEDEVANLREEVSTMKAMLEKMERLLMASAASAAKTHADSPHHSHAPAGASMPRQVSQPMPASRGPSGYVPSQPIAASYPHPHPSMSTAAPALPPIPRAVTPPSRYEELFTDVMLPSHEPEFAALTQLIMASPMSRLEAIFPPPPAAPSLPMPVVLSLAYRLSQLLANKDGPVDDADKRHLLWLRKAIAACDGKQTPEIVALIPRILTNVVDNLVTRGRRLMAMNDQAGANEVRLVTQYAHARLTLFQQAGADGPGVETFRR